MGENKKKKKMGVNEEVKLEVSSAENFYIL